MIERLYRGSKVITVQDGKSRTWDHLASASQLAKALKCFRKWWFETVIRMPRYEKSHFTYGTALHAVIERYLRSDIRGRDAAGEKVELYPEGWEAGLEPHEAAQIKMLVARAVDSTSGVLRREAGCEIEHEFLAEVIPEVGMYGKVDVFTPTGIEDHKSSSRAQYALSADSIREDPQMLVYAHERMRTWTEPRETVTLRHNFYCKDPRNPLVKETTTEVSTEVVLRFWDETVVPAIRAMLELKNQGWEAEDWEKVSGPAEPGICLEYGGCPFQEICGRQETPAQYRARISRMNANVVKKAEEPDMSIWDRLNAKKKPADAAAGTETQVAELPPENLPPWAAKDCRACGGKGISSVGKVCPVCSAIQAERSGPQAKDYKITYTESGKLKWERNESLKAQDGREIGGAEVVPGPAPEAPALAEVSAPDAVVPKPKRQYRKRTVASPTTAVASPLAQEAAASCSLDGETRSAPAFTLLIGATVIGARAVIDLHQVFFDAANALAAELKEETYYGLKSFDRRDLLASRADRIVASFPDGAAVVAIGRSPDFDAFVAAIRPFAGLVVVGAL